MLSIKVWLFSYPTVKMYVLGAQKSFLNETVLLSTHNKCFGWEIYFFFYPLLTKGLTYIVSGPHPCCVSRSDPIVHVFCCAWSWSKTTSIVYILMLKKKATLSFVYVNLMARLICIAIPGPLSGQSYVYKSFTHMLYLGNTFLFQHDNAPIPAIWQWTVCKLIMSWERSGSVVECLTRDWEAAGSSLTGVTTLWSLSKTHLS